MKRWKRFLNLILFPKLAVVITGVPVSAALLVYTFLYEAEDSPVAYLSYVLSAYALTVVCARIIRMPKGGLKAALHRNPYVHRYLTEAQFQTHVSLYLSLGINLLFAAMKLFYGVHDRSVWFGTLAAYYIMLAVMRFLLLRHVKRNAIGKALVSELRQYRLCGVILLLMNIVLSGVVVLLVLDSEGFHYPGYLIYVVAMYAFYNMISAARDMIRYRKYQSPVLSAAKAIKLAAALVSILSLETAMLVQFDTGERSPVFKKAMTATTGGGVCLFVLVMAIVMIVTSSKRLGRLRNSSMEP